MLSITPSKLTDFITCPLKYKLRYLTGSRSRESSPALAFGNSIHQALQAIHDQNKFVQSPVEASELLKKFWDKSAFKDDDEEAEYFEKGCRSLESYSRVAAVNNEKTLATETFMSLIIDFRGLKVRLGCKADRLVIHPNNQLEIVDYKTNRSGKIPTQDFLTNDLSTFLYYILTRLKFPQYPQIRITLLNVLTMSKTTVQYDAETLEKNKRALWECLKTIARDNHQPRPSEDCAWCPFQDNCPTTNQVVDYRSI